MELIHRRDLLADTLVTAGSVTLFPSCLRAAPAHMPKLTFAVVSDTHLGYKDQTHAGTQWAKTVEELRTTNAEFVIHLGDIVDAGREPQYGLYLKQRDRLKMPVHEIPGNHDPLDLFRKHIRTNVDQVVDHQWLRCILINNARTDSHDGFVTDQQINWIERQCSAAEDEGKYVLLCLHVPVHANRHPDRGWYVKPENGQTKLYALIRKYRLRIVAMLHGHFHNGIRGWKDDDGVHEICMPSVLYNLDRGLEAQKAPGYNPLEFRPGYTLVSIQQGSLELRYKPIGEAATIQKRCEFGTPG